jgi:hypothetical protein
LDYIIASSASPLSSQQPPSPKTFSSPRPLPPLPPRPCDQHRLVLDPSFGWMAGPLVSSPQEDRRQREAASDTITIRPAVEMMCCPLVVYTVPEAVSERTFKTLTLTQRQTDRHRCECDASVASDHRDQTEPGPSEGGNGSSFFSSQCLPWSGAIPGLVSVTDSVTHLWGLVHDRRWLD